MMNKSIWQRLVAAPLVAALIFTAIVPAAVLAQETAATQPARSAEATGTLPGGSFAKIWLGLTPVNPGTVTLRAEWDRENAGPSGIGFYVLDENNLAAVVNGASLPANNVGAGNSNFYLNGPSNVQGTSFRATGTSYTVVLYNDSNGDANFSLSVDNGLLSDDNNQVTLVGVESATPEATEEGATAPAASETTVAATAVATATATAAATTVAATTATTITAPAAPAAVSAPAGGPVRAETMQGELPNQFDQHFLALEPTIKDGDISLELTYDPQDSTELARRINFWVLDQTGFTRFQAGDSPSSVAIAAGSKSFLDPDNSNKRVAAFKATGFGPYTVIVQNNSRVPATYNLTVTGGELIDDSAQTLTAQQAGGAAAAPAADTTTDAAATTTTPATTTTAATTTTPAAGTGVAGQPGGTYVVKEGDTLAIIARDLYGDFRLYEQLCAFNQIADCNVIEVGQTINLPTAEQIGATTTTAAAAATPAAAATTAAAAATPAATAAAVATTATTTTTAPAATTAVTTTAAVTRTTATTAVGATTPATGTAATTTAAGSIVDVAEDNGNFTILIEALQKTGLDEELGGGGPFTVFAPTDAAFTAWLEKNNVTEETLLRASDLPAMLQYHVLSGKVLAADLTNGLKVTTLQGQPVTFKIVDGKVYVNDSQVVTTDIQTANGVIHTIDQPMLVPLSQ